MRRWRTAKKPPRKKTGRYVAIIGALKAMRIFQEDVADKKETGDKLVVTDAE